MPKAKARSGYERLKKHRETVKSQRALIAALFEDAPDGFGRRVRFRFEYDADGVEMVTINLPDQECADHVNSFAASVGINPNVVLNALAKEAGRRLVNGDFRVSKGE